MRTSLTHPLQINDISLASGGRIGLTFCPGKQQRYAATGAWNRDLAMDLARIQAWGAQAVVTLMEDHELADLKVAHLGAEVEALGLDWIACPSAMLLSLTRALRPTGATPVTGCDGYYKQGGGSCCTARAAWGALVSSPPGCWWSVAGTLRWRSKRSERLGRGPSRRRRRSAMCAPPNRLRVTRPFWNGRWAAYSVAP